MNRIPMAIGTLVKYQRNFNFIPSIKANTFTSDQIHYKLGLPIQMQDCRMRNNANTKNGFRPKCVLYNLDLDKPYTASFNVNIAHCSKES